MQHGKGMAMQRLEADTISIIEKCNMFDGMQHGKDINATMGSYYS